VAATHGSNRADLNDIILRCWPGKSGATFVLRPNNLSKTNGYLWGFRATSGRR